MRKSWRTWSMLVLLGIWPHLGCHQLPADKSVRDLQPIQKDAASTKKQELSAADITHAAWRANVDALEKAGKVADAIILCERMRQPGNPQAEQATRRIAVLYERANEPDKAEQEYRLLLKRNPKDADALAKLGDLNRRRGQWGAAEKFYSDAVFHKPDLISAWSGLAMALAQNGSYDKSLEAYKKVLPSEAEAYCEVAFVMSMQGKSGEAIRMYEEALRKEPRMPRATRELARLRLTDAAPSMTPSQTGQRGVVEHETTPLRVGEGTGRRMELMPTLGPLPALDYVDVPGEGEMAARGKNKSN